ncbi:MAG: murein hydrolase activator EnvC family protein [Myxococcaceae bacterium]
MTQRLGPALVVLMAAAALAQGAGAEQDEEQVDVRARLRAEREALSALAQQEGKTRIAWELAERLMRHALNKRRRLEEEEQRLERQVRQAEAREALAREVLSVEVQKLRPRLLGLYRLSGHRRMAWLLSASDLAGLTWRVKTLARWLAADLNALRATERMARRQARALSRLDALKWALAEYRLWVDEELHREREQSLAWRDLLELIRAKARAGRTQVKELERADAEMAALLAELTRPPPSHGFGALRGKLDYPTAGMLEARYGKVINPKFNTVTTHKGIDIRAKAASPVRAIAPGKVAWTGALKGYGTVLILEHADGYHSLMAHLVSVSRNVGETVSAGDVVAAVGDTGSTKGSYLYFELRERGLAIDPVPWFRP